MPPSPVSQRRSSTWNLPSEGKPVGGDWCFAVALTGDVFALTVGDVCGHDAAAAEAMMRIRAAIVAAIDGTRDPAAVLAMACCCIEGVGRSRFDEIGISVTVKV